MKKGDHDIVPTCHNCGLPASHRYWDKFVWAYFCPVCADTETDQPIPTRKLERLEKP